MKCIKCSAKAVFSALCKDHFRDSFLDKVKKTIRDYRLFTKSDKVVVAVSGGKDSLVVLSVLNNLGYNVSGLAIDEGISGYRDEKLIAMRMLCTEMQIPCEIIAFRDEFGFTLDQAVKRTGLVPCTVCGVLRRKLLNKYAKGDVVATGHNLDDEAQAIFMNLLKNNTDLLARQGPVSGVFDTDYFVKRTKPLFMCYEKEVLIYSMLEGIETPFLECPHVSRAFRAKVRDALNEYEAKHKGSKKNIILSYLKISDKLKSSHNASDMKVCKICGGPASGQICQACNILEEIKNVH